MVVQTCPVNAYVNGFRVQYLPHSSRTSDYYKRQQITKFFCWLMLITDEPFDFLLAVTMPRHQVNDLASERPEGASLKSG